MTYPKGYQYKLKYWPLPRDKAQREYTIGEALLRSRQLSEEELATLRKLPEDEAADLTANLEAFGEITIEVTESVTYNRAGLAESKKFIEKLKANLCELGTSASKPSNIYISVDEPVFPKVCSKEIKRIAESIHDFFNGEDFIPKYRIIREFSSLPVRVAYVPAEDCFISPAITLENKIFVKDISGIRMSPQQTELAIERIMKKKKHVSPSADILAIYDDIPSMLSYENIANKLNDHILSELPHKGIYIVHIVNVNKGAYWVSVRVIREHPVFQK